MTLVISERSNSREFKPVPAGTHLAVCTAVVDMGVQDGGRYEPKPKVYLRWELPEQLASWRNRSGEECTGPMTVGKSYTKSLAPMATLRQDLETWRGKSFSEAEVRNFNLTTILGKPCMLGIVHRDTGERVYASVATVTGAPAGAAPTASGRLIAYDIDDPDPEAFDALPSWLKEKIRSRLVGTQTDTTQPPVQIPAAEFDDVIPF